MNTMKKLIPFLLIVLLSLAACGQNNNADDIIVAIPTTTEGTQADSSQTATAVPPTAMPTATPDVQATHMAAQATLIAAQATTIANLQATAVAPTQTPAPTATPVDVDDFMTDPSCSLLQDSETIFGTACFPRDDKAPDYRIPVAEGGFSFVALGSGEFDGEDLSPVAEDIGHIVLFIGSEPDGSTPKDLNKGVTMSDYVPGAVGVTHITYETDYEEAIAAATEHAEGMIVDDENNDSCGAEACNESHLWLWNWETGELKLIEKFERD